MPLMSFLKIRNVILMTKSLRTQSFFMDSLSNSDLGMPTETHGLEIIIYTSKEPLVKVALFISVINRNEPSRRADGAWGD